MSSLKAWIVAGRFFAIPWILVNTFLGAKLAGFNLSSWLLSFAIVMAILISSHYMNAWRDYVRGFDKLEKGSKEKPYTSASKLISAGLFTVKEAIVATVVCLVTGFVLFLLFAPKTVDTIITFAIGVFCAVTYSDFFKPRGLGEIPLFLGHGFGTVTFSYSLVRPISIEAVVAGILLGMWASILYTVDQWQDVETDFLHRIKSYAYVIAKANLRLSTFLYFGATAIATLHLAFVLMGMLPQSTLLALLLLPLIHFTGVMLDYQFEKGVFLTLLSAWLYPIFMAVQI